MRDSDCTSHQPWDVLVLGNGVDGPLIGICWRRRGSPRRLEGGVAVGGVHLLTMGTKISRSSTHDMSRHHSYCTLPSDERSQSVSRVSVYRYFLWHTHAHTHVLHSRRISADCTGASHAVTVCMLTRENLIQYTIRLNPTCTTMRADHVNNERSLYRAIGSMNHLYVKAVGLDAFFTVWMPGLVFILCFCRWACSVGTLVWAWGFFHVIARYSGGGNHTAWGPRCSTAEVDVVHRLINFSDARGAGEQGRFGALVFEYRSTFTETHVSWLSAGLCHITVYDQPMRTMASRHTQLMHGTLPLEYGTTVTVSLHAKWCDRPPFWLTLVYARLRLNTTRTLIHNALSSIYDAMTSSRWRRFPPRDARRLAPWACAWPITMSTIRHTPLLPNSVTTRTLSDTGCSHTCWQREYPSMLVSHDRSRQTSPIDATESWHPWHTAQTFAALSCMQTAVPCWHAWGNTTNSRIWRFRKPIPLWC